MDTMETKTETVFRLSFDGGAVKTETTTLAEVAAESSIVSVMVAFETIAPFLVKVHSDDLLDNSWPHLTGRVPMTENTVTFRRSQIVAVIA